MAALAGLDVIVAVDLFGLTAGELAYVLDSFLVVQPREVKRFGEYWSKRTILGLYDSLPQVVRVGNTPNSGHTEGLGGAP
jgi:hypothetical protein